MNARWTHILEKDTRAYTRFEQFLLSAPLPTHAVALRRNFFSCAGIALITSPPFKYGQMASHYQLRWVLAMLWESCLCGAIIGESHTKTLMSHSVDTQEMVWRKPFSGPSTYTGCTPSFICRANKYLAEFCGAE